MRSVVCTASYEARPFGVHSAMPMVEAMRRCPQAVVIPPKMEKYAGVSAEIMRILRRYSPLVEALSLDEAFLDVTESYELFGDGPTIAAQIRADIRAETHLTASAGVATSKFVAKVASDFKKPDGLTVVAPGEEQAFLAPLPVERMWGVGKKASAKLRKVGLATIADLARTSPASLGAILGSSWGEYMSELARGLDPRPVVPDREAVSIGAEETFEIDVLDREFLQQKLLGQAARVASTLTRRGLVAKTVVLKVKLADHTLLTRRTTMPEAVQDTLAIHRAVSALLDKVELGRRGARLTGVSVTGLVRETEEQRAFFADEASDKRRALEKTLLDVRSRFGDGSLVQAGTLLGRKR